MSEEGLKKRNRTASLNCLRCSAAFSFYITTRWHVKWFCKPSPEAARPAQIPEEAFQLPKKDRKALKTLKHYGTTDTKESVSFSEFGIQKKLICWGFNYWSPLLAETCNGVQTALHLKRHPSSSLLLKPAGSALEVAVERTDRHLHVHQAKGVELSSHNRGQRPMHNPCSLSLQQLQDTFHPSNSVSWYTAGDVVFLREEPWLQSNFCPSSSDLNYWGQKNLCNLCLNFHGSLIFF